MLNNLNWSDTFETDNSEKTSALAPLLHIARFFKDTFNAALMASLQSPDMGASWNYETTSHTEIKKMQPLMNYIPLRSPTEYPFKVGMAIVRF